MNPQSTVGPAFSFAFQPIVDAVAHSVVSQEALIRGANKESAGQVLEQVCAEDLHRFDQQARVQAILLATGLGLDSCLNLNFLPRSLEDSPQSILSVLETARQTGLPAERVVLEVTEGEVIEDQAHFAERINEYRATGLKVAIDDFGAGYSGLNLLVEFQPDQIKLDMKLVRDIERHGPRQAIVRAMTQACFDLGIDVIAEGVETVDEFAWLANEGIRLFQGYLFAKPAFESFSSIRYPDAPNL